MHQTIAPLIRGAAALALCALSLGSSACSAHGQGYAAPPEIPEVELEEPLSLSVDALDVRHGSLRIEASMEDGSADVSMWLGPSCEKREVGRGIATRSGFAWSLSSDDVAQAIACGLVVQARTRNEDGARVRKVAPLDVALELVDDSVEDVRLLRLDSGGESVTLAFASQARASRLHVGGVVIGAEDLGEDEEEKLPDGSFTATFTVGSDDLARSILHRRQISVLGQHFLAAIRVGSLTLDVAGAVEEPGQEVIIESCCGDG